MLTNDTVSFLKATPPFDCLDDAVLAAMVKDMVLTFYPRGETILRQNGPAAEHLSLIRNGAVKVFITTNQAEEVLVDTRTSGEFFGMRSFLLSDVCLDTIVASEDTTCYLLRKESVLGLLKTNAAFSEFCLRTILQRLLKMAYQEVRDRTLLYGGGDKLLFTNILGDLATRTVVTAPEDISIREAAGIMADRNISSLVLLDQAGLPSGMVTDKDLRKKVVAKGRDPEAKVSDIMSITLIKADERDRCFEALVKMIRYNIHHLLVVNKGELKGIMTSHDLMLLQGTSPLAVAREIESQDTIDGLVPAAAKINRTITILIREGAKSGAITRIITEVNDRLLNKVISITAKRLGPPPAAFCWIAFGSEGRKEQTFRTDQDNAIIYEDREGDNWTTVRYFAEFGEVMRDALARCGFPPCSANYMASNPKWRMPLSAWKRTFSSWIREPAPEQILQSLIFFDFRPIHGDILLAERLRAYLGQEVKEKGLFLAHMAATVLKNRPPLDFLGRFQREKKGEHCGKFNIKINGLGPIIDLARLSALEQQVYHTSTLERLADVKDRCRTIGPFSDDLMQAFEFLMSLRLRHQYQEKEEGREPDNFIDPRQLGALEQTMLKESFKLIIRAQEALRKKYASWQVM